MLQKEGNTLKKDRPNSIWQAIEPVSIREAGIIISRAQRVVDNDQRIPIYPIVPNNLIEPLVHALGDAIGERAVYGKLPVDSADADGFIIRDQLKSSYLRGIYDGTCEALRLRDQEPTLESIWVEAHSFKGNKDSMVNLTAAIGFIAAVLTIERQGEQ